MSASLEEFSRDASGARAACLGRAASPWPGLTYAFLALLGVYVVARGMVGAAARPFWFDEVLTLTIASRANWHAMWEVIRTGVDSQPPLFYLVERLALHIPIKQEVALRLPSILAFATLLVCVFLYTKRRGGEWIGCLCAFALLSTVLFEKYLIEARGYGLMLAFLALAAVCYQRLPSLRWTVLLGASLFLAESFHYYAVFAMVPFALAETVASLRTFRIRWPVWVALGCGAVPLLALWRVVSQMKRYYGTAVFSPPLLSRIPEFYGSLFLTDDVFGVALAVAITGTTLWVAIQAGLAWARWMPGVPWDVAPTEVPDWAQETLVLGLSALPLITYEFLRVMHGGLIVRYVLPTTVGLVLGLAWVLVALERKTVALVAVLLLVTVGVREMRFWHHWGFDPRVRDYDTRPMSDFAELQRFVDSSGYLDLPVVFSETMLYLPVVHYCPAEWNRRLVYLTDERRELRYEGTDNVVKIVEGMADFLPMRLEDYTKFTAEHRQFLVYSEPTEWASNALRDEGNAVQVLKVSGNRWLYLVTMKDGKTETENGER